MKTMAAAKLKATCLSVMDEGQANRKPVTITKAGKPIAEQVTLEIAALNPLADFRFPGEIEIIGDIISPLFSVEETEQFLQRSLRQLQNPDEDVD